MRATDAAGPAARTASGGSPEATAEAATPRRTGPRLRIRPQYLAVPVLLVVLWELAVVSGLIDARSVPAPHTVARTWWTWAAGGPDAAADPYSGTWLPSVYASTQRVLFGFALSAVAGTAVGLLIGWSRWARMLLQPVIDILRPIPTTAWVPFAVVFFGIQPTASIFLIALGCFPPIVLNATAGARGTPDVLVSAARMLGTSPQRTLWRVGLPSALPSLLTGLRVGLALAWVLVIVSEMVAVKSGLGFSLWDAYYFGRMDVIVVAMLTVGLLGYLSDKLLNLAARPVLKWAPDVR
ncbi:NitT/TauT family transport system permease protein [Prauserella aidingensis]|uniref:ABC transporter permease n=1 Tax=Prauserella aidingensis TaxID=387890 RepID=UPI0020A4DA08|nr:ABC transporter permease [Prauserella aidingensis]MCP2253760.1 NitT/TauT family transport system permease protein [Prauserella aidingensis]